MALLASLFMFYIPLLYTDECIYDDHGPYSSDSAFVIMFWGLGTNDLLKKFNNSTDIFYKRGLVFCSLFKGYLCPLFMAELFLF